MSSKQYRVILSGRLLPGFSHESALPKLADIFDAHSENLRSALDGSEHPISDVLDAEQALDLQTRLETAGVASRIERVSDTKKISLHLRSTMAAATEHADDTTVAPGMIRCPSCGNRQPVSNRCNNCGVVFVEYQRQQQLPQPQQYPEERSRSEEPRPESRPAIVPTTPRPEDFMFDFVDDKEPDESYYLSLFFGPNSDAYLRVCRKYIKGMRTTFAFGWNWAAVASPFLWTVYRKMWMWSVVLFFTELFLPVLFLTVGHYDPTMHRLTLLGYAGLIANRLFWPAVLDYLYCRYARGVLRRLQMLSPNYASEIDVATTGGVSRLSTFTGVAIALVAVLFIWSLMDSIYQTSRQAVQQRVEAQADVGDGSGNSPQTMSMTNRSGTLPVDDPTGIVGAAPSSGTPIGEQQSPARHPTVRSTNRWVETRRKLRVLGQSVSNWLAQRPGVSIANLTLTRLQTDMNLTAQQLQDAWGNQVQLVPDNAGFRLISAGPDGLFGTPDDIQYRGVVPH